MTYKRISKDMLPPHMRNISLDEVNTYIKKAFSETLLNKDIKQESHYINQTKIYLDSSRVEKVVKVQIINIKGSEITYKENLNTGSYASNIEINRPLEVGETLHIEYVISPGYNDLFTKFNDLIYIRSDIYKTLLDIIYKILKSQEKGVKKEDGKN